MQNNATAMERSMKILQRTKNRTTFDKDLGEKDSLTVITPVPF